jgi:hypothetical protein
MSNIEKIIDRVRKLLALSEGAGSEHEAALAAGRATTLIAEYQLTEAQLRVDDATLPPEPIERGARLEPDAPATGRKRVAWKETIALAVAKDLGVKMHWKYHYTPGSRRKSSDVCGFGRESAIQTWRYTCQYLWRTIDELAEAQTVSSWQSVRAYRNAYRVGCSQRIAERIWLARRDRENEAIVAAHFNDEPDGDASAGAGDGGAVDRSKALAIVESDREEVETEYKAYSKGFSTVGSIGQTSNRSGYDDGREAGDKVKLGGGGKGLPAGQGRLKKGNKS